jgi:hypothetical protein
MTEMYAEVDKKLIEEGAYADFTCYERDRLTVRARYVYMCTCLCVCEMYMCVCVCMYVWSSL